MAAWAGAIALALGLFAALTQQRGASGEGGTLDRAILLQVAELRTPPLTAIMIGVTRLGSPRPFAVITLVALVALIALGDRRGALHLAIAGLGTWILEVATKGLLERARPTEVVPLRQVSGYSYPSGHALAASALYLTMAILLGGRLRGRTPKALVMGGVLLLIFAIAVSRVYLGVHYPSDVLGGVALGSAWALVLAAAFNVRAAKK